MDLEDSTAQQPYMECSHIPASNNEGSDKSDADLEDVIREINRDNFKAELDKNKATVIAVFAKRCQACRELEPKLPELQRMLREELGQRKLAVVKIDIQNETHFLK